jgi:hypothetical protein
MPNGVIITVARSPAPFVASTLSDAIDAMATNSFAQFDGGGLTSTSTHPILGTTVRPMDDGKGGSAVPIHHYSGKGCYDPIGRRVLMMATGYSVDGFQNADASARRCNVLPMYDEATNNWSALARGFRQADGADTDIALVHMYDGNCIAANRRQLIKKSLYYPSLYVYDLAGNQMLNALAGPSPQSGSQATDGIEFIPTRGSYGAIWWWGWNNNNALLLREFQFSAATGIAGSWSTIADTTAFNDTTWSEGPTISYNPRAFSGAGGVLLGSATGQWTVNCSTLAVTAIGRPNSLALDVGSDYLYSGLCADPVGVGWLKFGKSAGYVYRWDGSAWEQRAALPAGITGAQDAVIVVPMDLLGAVWLLRVNGDSNAQANYLYRP